eukprot:UN28071
MERFYNYTMEYFKYLCTVEEDKEILQRIDVFSRASFALSHDMPEKATGKAKQTLLQIFKQIQSTQQMPDLYQLFYFKLLTNIFPMSDFAHPISCSLLLTINYCLTRCSIEGVEDILSGLFLLTLIIDSVKETKRFVPECIEFIKNLLKAGFSKDSQFLEFGFEIMKEETQLYFQFQKGSNIWVNLEKKAMKSDKIEPMNLSNLISAESVTAESCLQTYS